MSSSILIVDDEPEMASVVEQALTRRGYKAKQVRDNIHSADLIAAIDAVFAAPRPGEVYNLGGGRFSNCSMLEAIALCEQVAGRPLTWSYDDRARMGDHMWYVSDLSKFQSHYPAWSPRFDLPSLLTDIYERNVERWTH